MPVVKEAFTACIGGAVYPTEFPAGTEVDGEAAEIAAALGKLVEPETKQGKAAAAKAKADAEADGGAA